MGAPVLTQELLKTLLIYDPITGVFTWLPRLGMKSWNTRYAGKAAGYDWQVNDHLAYRSIRIFDWPFLAHRLAVLCVTGEWPAEDVDHDDRDGLNNRWVNLRPATKGQNGANSGPTRKNKTGLKGVSPQGKFGYRATFRGKHLGSTRDPLEAARLYELAAVAAYGAFARPK